jgi:cupin fold WbuC family metalloprotein
VAEVYFNDQDICVVGKSWLTRLKVAANESPRGIARLCMHRSVEEPVQEMIIALRRDALFGPHRHHGKTESFHVIEGRLTVLLFNETGDLDQTIDLGEPLDGSSFCYRLAAPIYHSVIPQTDMVVFSETTVGPFRKSDTDLAPWAPEYGEELRAFFVAKLVRFAGSAQGPDGVRRALPTSLR